MTSLFCYVYGSIINVGVRKIEPIKISKKNAYHIICDRHFGVINMKNIVINYY